MASGRTGIRCARYTGCNCEQDTCAQQVGKPDAPLQALIFDSMFNSFRGIIVYFRVRNGSIKKGDKVKFVSTDQEYIAE